MRGHLSHVHDAGRLLPKSLGFAFIEGIAKQLSESVAVLKTLVHRLRRRGTAMMRPETIPTLSDVAQDQCANGASLSEQPVRVCPVCRIKLSAARDGAPCPVCLLRTAAREQSAIFEGLPWSSGSPGGYGQDWPMPITHRFENYELMLDRQGKPIELGRGAMGIAYKGFDVDLRIPVTLKVISERYLGDESVRLRFLREARAAASVRHTNVASVFHLGRCGHGYFYAMEFVEGETLERVIKRSGPLEVKLALSITVQVANGLAAVQKKNLVHRDIKPSNIIVCEEEGGTVTAKIIDLGLAKIVAEPQSDMASSAPGCFVGTPEFASPEQFSGVDVDIRSDLYSFGITLWEMLAGQVPFRGTPAEVMYQHLYAPLPLERLRTTPGPIVTLVQKLLEKNPARRFQTPNELVQATLACTDSTEAILRIKPRKQETIFLRRLSCRRTKLPVPRGTKRTVAVLPFESVSAGEGITYFADGIQDEILSNLAKVSRLKVISRTSVMKFRPGANLPSIAESLGVANVFVGTVRRDGDRVRITIRLVNAQADRALWSESYDRDLTDILTVQREIARAVAVKLISRLASEEKQRLAAKPANKLQIFASVRNLFYGFAANDPIRIYAALLLFWLAALLACPLPSLT
jgi:serine/threonine protein kinase